MTAFPEVHQDCEKATVRSVWRRIIHTLYAAYNNLLCKLRVYTCVCLCAAIYYTLSHTHTHMHTCGTQYCHHLYTPPVTTFEPSYPLSCSRCQWLPGELPHPFLLLSTCSMPPLLTAVFCLHHPWLRPSPRL